MEAYVHGVSTRSVDDLVEALGVGSGISKSEVSRICGGLDEIVGAFRTRPLDHIEFPYVYLDATGDDGAVGLTAAEKAVEHVLEAFYRWRVHSEQDAVVPVTR